MALYVPCRQRVILCKESTAGTIITTGGVLGAVSNISNDVIGSTQTEDAYLGIGISNFSITPNTGRYGQLTWNELLRADGPAAFLLMGMLGVGSDVLGTPASGFNTHTASVNNAPPVTYTALHDTGILATSGQEYVQYPYATAASLGLSWSVSQSPMWSVQMSSIEPVPGTPTPSIASRTVLNRARNTNAVYTFQSATAGTLYPTADVVSGSLTFARPCNPVPTAGQDSATDISPAGLTLSGGFELIYRGSTANTAFADWLLWKEQGTVSNQSKIKWTMADTSSVEIDWWPMVMSSCKITPTGDSLHVAVQFSASNDLGTANVSGTTGLSTSPSSVVLNNKLTATAMN